MCLCEKFEFAGNFRRLFSNDPWGESQHMRPFIECIFALKNVRCWQWNEGGKSKILRQFWTSWALAFRKCKICKCKGQNVHLLHIFIEKQKKSGTVEQKNLFCMNGCYLVQWETSLFFSSKLKTETVIHQT